MMYMQTLARQTMPARTPTFRRFVPLLLLPVLGFLVGCQTTPVEYPTGPDRLAAPPVQPAGFETPPTFAPEELLPVELVSGPHHEVVAPVVNDGMINHYLIHSDFGVYQTVGRDMTEERIREIHAIAALQAMETHELAEDGFESRVRGVVKAPYRQVRKIVRNPLHLVAVIPGEIGMVAGIVSELGVFVRHGFSASAIKEMIGFYDSKKDVARSLEVDPNSTNPVLQAELDRAAWAYFGGEAPLRIADDFIPGLPISEVEIVEDGEDPVEAVEIISDEVRGKSTGSQLRRMDVPRADRKAFRKNEAFTDRQRKRLVRALYDMKETEKRHEVIQFAARIESDTDAFRILEHIEMMADYHRNVEPIERVLVAEPLLLAHTEADALILPLYCEYLAWTQETAELLERLRTVEVAELPVDTRQIWLAGGASSRVEDECAQLAFAVRREVDEPLESGDRWLLAEMRYRGAGPDAPVLVPAGYEFDPTIRLASEQD